jgi:hypothetical protein
LERHHIPDPARIVFLEITITDSSEFETDLYVSGTYCEEYRVLRVASPAVANAIAALLLRIRDSTGAPPHIYFDWTEGNPVVNLLRYLFSGVGEVAPVTREILRRAEPVRPATGRPCRLKSPIRLSGLDDGDRHEMLGDKPHLHLVGA